MEQLVSDILLLPIDQEETIDFREVNFLDFLTMAPYIEKFLHKDVHFVITTFNFSCGHHDLLGKCKVKKFNLSENKFKRIMNFFENPDKLFPIDIVPDDICKALYEMYFNLKNTLNFTSYKIEKIYVKPKPMYYWRINFDGHTGNMPHCSCDDSR